MCYFYFAADVWSTRQTSKQSVWIYGCFWMNRENWIETVASLYDEEQHGCRECLKHGLMGDSEQAAGKIASMQGEQGRWSGLCQASPERGVWLGGGPFVGEVAGGDSLSFTTSSPTCTNTHTDTYTVRNSEGSAEHKVTFVRQREVNTVYKQKSQVSLGLLCITFGFKIDYRTWINYNKQKLLKMCCLLYNTKWSRAIVE